MPVRRITATESFAGIDLGERRAREDYATIPGAGWSRVKLDGLRDDAAGQGSDSAQDLPDAGSALDPGTWDPAIGNFFTGNCARLPGG